MGVHSPGTLWRRVYDKAPPNRIDCELFAVRAFTARALFPA